MTENKDAPSPPSHAASQNYDLQQRMEAENNQAAAQAMTTATFTRLYHMSQIGEQLFLALGCDAVIFATESGKASGAVSYKHAVAMDKKTAESIRDDLSKIIDNWIE